MEAIIGAIYLDGGLRSAYRFIHMTFSPEIRLVEAGKGERDYKSILQQASLRKFKTIPVYKIISEIGPEHKKIFTIAILINNKKYGEGFGPNKKKAEQLAAKEALSIIEPDLI